MADFKAQCSLSVEQRTSASDPKRTFAGSNSPLQIDKLSRYIGGGNETTQVALRGATDPDEIAMRKRWLQRLEIHLPYLSQWRLISTAPYNRELELRITDNGETVTLEFPCLRTNEEAWINVDLGTEIKVQPVEWRVWQGGKSPEPHYSKIRLAAKRALTHLYLRHVKRRDNDDNNFAP
jgi:hypothetical protein